MSNLRTVTNKELYNFILQVNGVGADLVLNRADYSWWSFHDINSSDIRGCGGLAGPMAVVVSEETPPRKFRKTLCHMYLLMACYGFSFILLLMLQQCFRRYSWRHSQQVQHLGSLHNLCACCWPFYQTSMRRPKNENPL